MEPRLAGGSRWCGRGGMSAHPTGGDHPPSRRRTSDLDHEDSSVESYGEPYADTDRANLELNESVADEIVHREPSRWTSGLSEDVRPSVPLSSSGSCTWPFGHSRLGAITSIGPSAARQKKGSPLRRLDQNGESGFPLVNHPEIRAQATIVDHQPEP